MEVKTQMNMMKSQGQRRKKLIHKTTKVTQITEMKVL